MRIERIRSDNLTGLGDVDWIFPDGPVLFFAQGKSRQSLLNSLLLEMLYNVKTVSPSEARNGQGLVEFWLAGESFRWHVSRQVCRQDGGGERTPQPLIRDETGQAVSLPERTVPGEYLFHAGVQAFRQGGLVEWPDSNKGNTIAMVARNLRQAGEEGLSAAKVRASFSGALKRVEEQEKRLQLQAEYASLRGEWEATHRRLEEERRVLIESKNLEEKAKILAGNLAAAEKMQERLALLAQNPDYRELRRLQGEMIRLEEERLALESSLPELRSEAQVDGAVLENLREECLEWARCQAEEERLAGEIQRREQRIKEAQNFLEESGYQGMTEDGAQRVRRTEEERLAAQAELDDLAGVQSEIDSLEGMLTEETIRLEGFADVARVTDREEIEIVRRETRLAQWQNSRTGTWVDRILEEQFDWKSIRRRLSDSLMQRYPNYRVANYKEFRRRLREFRDQKQKVERLARTRERLREKVGREEELRQVMHSRTEILREAFASAKAVDLQSWLKGWEIYRQKKEQLDNWLHELRFALDRQQSVAKELATCAAQLRGKLENWGTTATDREEALAAILRVAVKLRAKDEVEKEFVGLRERFQALLGERNMEHLAEGLEPLADLERETHLAEEERAARLAAWQQELAETRKQLARIRQRPRSGQGMSSLAILEQKMEDAKRRWLAMEGLCRALVDARALWETCWQEWQTNYGQTLEEEARKISSRTSAGNYFAYRMALAQLALGENTEVPLLFSAGGMKEGQGFWEEVAEYLQKLSRARQVILSVSDAGLWQVLARTGGWQKSGDLK